MIRTLTRVFLAAVVLAAAAPALAGPPLLCHPFDIGSAKSLPWNGQASWFDGRADYPIANLVGDTEALLQPSTPVVVRMETVRRAAIYASRDPKVASALVQRLTLRAKGPDPLAALDAAYAIEALRQIGMFREDNEFGAHPAAVRQVIEGRSGMSYVNELVRARPDDPGIAFAAAVITLDKDKAAADKYAAEARARASRDPLVAKNLGRLF